MKKFTLMCAAIAAFWGTAANAQSLTIAPEVGANLSTLSGDIDDNSMKLGLKAGVVVNIGIDNNLSIQPGIFYSMKGTKFESEILGVNFDASMNINYIEVPLNIVYKFGPNAGGAFIFAGPYAGYALSAKIKAEDESEDIPFEEGGLKRLDLGLNAGLGYMLDNGLYFRGQYGLGLTNIVDSDEGSLKNNVISLSIGLMLGGN